MRSAIDRKAELPVAEMKDEEKAMLNDIITQKLKQLVQLRQKINRNENSSITKDQLTSMMQDIEKEIMKTETPVNK